MALLLAVSVIALILYLAMEVMYETNVEYVVNSQALNRLKAYYAAKSGVEISLLRIKIYKQIKKQLGNNSGNSSMGQFVEQIWRFPLMWPLPTSENMGAATKDDFKKVASESWIDATFDTRIEDESSKIDINDLISPSKVLRENTRKQLMNIYQERLKADENFQRKYSSFRFDELINNIADWMSGVRESLNGGDKRNPYREYNTETLPPNRGFRTLSEMRIVAMMNDELFAMLEPRITIYGMRGVNPNTASKEVLMSLDPGITSEIADKAIARRSNPNQGGPFAESKEGDVSAFQTFLEQQGARLDPEFNKIPFVYGSIVAFKISSIGQFAKALRKLNVITFDVDESASRLADRLKKENPGSSTTTTTNNGGPNSNPAQGPGSNNKSNTNGPPRIVYWTEE